MSSKLISVQVCKTREMLRIEDRIGHTTGDLCWGEGEPLESTEHLGIKFRNSSTNVNESRPLFANRGSYGRFKIQDSLEISVHTFARANISPQPKMPLTADSRSILEGPSARTQLASLAYQLLLLSHVCVIIIIVNDDDYRVDHNL